MTYIHERADGVKIEYRRNPCDSQILFLEHRELRKNGMPFDEQWFPVTDAHLLWIQREDSDIVHLLEME